MALDYKNSLGRYRRYLSNLQNQPLWNTSFWLGLTIILIIALVVLALRPTLVTIAALMGKNREQKALLTRIDGKLETLGQAQTNLSQVKDNLGVLDLAIPKISQWAELTDKITQIVNEGGVKMKTLEISEVVIQGQEIKTTTTKPVGQEKLAALPEGVQKVTFNLGVAGEYKQLRGLLSSMEAEGRLLVISSVRINRQKDGMLDMTVDGFAAYFAPTRENI